MLILWHRQSDDVFFGTNHFYDWFHFIVRRIGMTKPPVKLGVGKKFLEKRKEPPSGKMKLVWQPQHFNIGGSMSMNDVKSLSHSKWRCKYHIVFVPKYRR